MIVEIQVLSQMDHPNIVAYHDSFERDGILMIEMEYADGGNLQVEMSISSSMQLWEIENVIFIWF